MLNGSGLDLLSPLDLIHLLRSFLLRLSVDLTAVIAPVEVVHLVDHHAELRGPTVISVPVDLDDCVDVFAHRQKLRTDRLNRFGDLLCATKVKPIHVSLFELLDLVAGSDIPEIAIRNLTTEDRVIAFLTVSFDGEEVHIHPLDTDRLDEVRIKLEILKNLCKKPEFPNHSIQLALVHDCSFFPSREVKVTLPLFQVPLGTPANVK